MQLNYLNQVDFEYVFSSTVILFLLFHTIKSLIYPINPAKNIAIFLIISYAFISKIYYFDFIVFLYSLPLSLFILIAVYFIQSKNKTFIPDNNDPAEINKNNIYLKIAKVYFALSILCILALAIIILYPFIIDISSPDFNSVEAILSNYGLALVAIPLSLPSLSFIFWYSIKFIYHGHYLFIGKAEFADQDNIKNVLEKSNIDYKIEPIISNKGNLVRILVDEKQGFKGRMVVQSFIIPRSSLYPY